MVTITKISQTPEKISFTIKGADNTLVNTFRRSITEIPTLAIDTVEFSKNDSALYDEIIAHRLGLVPLEADKTFTEPSKCTCAGKGCLKCRGALKLAAKGPCTVYAKDMKGKAIQIVHPDTPIVILAKDQELAFVAEACLGCGNEHAKFSPGLAWFNSIANFKSKDVKDVEKYISVCPRKAILAKGNKLSADELKCDLCEACVELSNELGENIELKASEEDFIFNIESFGQLNPKDIFIESINALDSHLTELSQFAKKLK
ncbi:MAG: DNA-directed RNA polymerase subunit D [archaeon]